MSIILQKNQPIKITMEQLTNLKEDVPVKYISKENNNGNYIVGIPIKNLEDFGISFYKIKVYCDIQRKDGELYLNIIGDYYINN